MSPSLDCKGYLNGLIFNFKVIRISQELDSQHYRISLKQALNSTISTAPFFSFISFLSFSFHLGWKNFGLDDMSPALDCNGYLNGLVFNFKIIRISQRADHFFVCTTFLKKKLFQCLFTALQNISQTSFKFNYINCTIFFLFQFSEGFFSFGLEKFWLRKYVSFIRL